jgi:hypothetical protein
MRIGRIPSSAQPTMVDVESHAGHRHSLPQTISRRLLLQGAAGAGAVAVAAGMGLLRPGVASAESINQVVPIPGGLEFFGDLYHVLAPPLTAADDDPSSVFNYQGTTGIAFISGEVERRNRRTGTVETLPYSFNDMRFMQGIYRTRQGKLREGTFGFV